MQNNITEQQLLIYVRGPEKARTIIDNNLPDHYRETFKKFENGQTIMWNWAAFFAGSFWFISKKMPAAFFTGLIGMNLLIGCASVLLGDYFALLICILSYILIGALGEKILMRHLLKKIQKSNFDDLAEKTKTAFLAKIGITEHQFLSCIYGEDNANTLIQHNVPNHYRQAFAEFACERKCVWNWAAVCNTSAWLIYRKAPYYALIYTIIFLGASIAEGYIPAVISFLTIVEFITIGLLGNQILLNHISKEVQKGNYSFLSRKGGETKLACGVLLSALLLVCLISLCYIWPSALSNSTIEFSLTETIGLAIGALIPFVAVFMYTQYQMREYKKTIPKD